MSTSVAFKQKSLFRAVPGLFSQRRLFNPATPFDNASVAQQTLTSILDSLGGILWLPNQHNYTLTTDTAVVESGDPVGYIGSHRQNLPENYVKNSMMVGAAVDTFPTNWEKTTGNGVSYSVLSTGVDGDGTYVEILMSGTDAGGATAYPVIAFNGSLASGLHPTVTFAQLWSGSFKIKAISGTQRLLRLRLQRVTSGNLNTGTVEGVQITPTNGAISGFKSSVLIAEADATQLRLYLDAPVAAGSGTWDNVFRIYAPQLERGKPTAFTPTYGEAISRGVNFEPAWQTTTYAKPLLGVDADGKSILTFDGTDDFFRTGIKTPEAGYIAGVWQTSSTGSTREMFSSSNGASVSGIRFLKTGTETYQMVRSDGVAVSTALSTELFGSSKVVMDGHYAVASAAIRKNGANEGANAASRTATSTNYLRIGVGGAGGDLQASTYWPGTMLAQIWVPGARPGATIEAEIRRLLAEITAVSGVV